MYGDGVYLTGVGVDVTLGGTTGRYVTGDVVVVGGGDTVYCGALVAGAGVGAYVDVVGVGVVGDGVYGVITVGAGVGAYVGLAVVAADVDATVGAAVGGYVVGAGVSGAVVVGAYVVGDAVSSGVGVRGINVNVGRIVKGGNGAGVDSYVGEGVRGNNVNGAGVRGRRVRMGGGVNTGGNFFTRSMRSGRPTNFRGGVFVGFGVPVPKMRPRSPRRSA
jgi:hypothetical protein